MDLHVYFMSKSCIRNDYKKKWKMMMWLIMYKKFGKAMQIRPTLPTDFVN